MYLAAQGNEAYILFNFIKWILHFELSLYIRKGVPSGANAKDLPANAREVRNAGSVPWWRAWQPTPMILPGASLGPRSLEGPQCAGSQRVRRDWSNLAGAHASIRTMPPKNEQCEFRHFTWEVDVLQVCSWRSCQLFPKPSVLVHTEPYPVSILLMINCFLNLKHKQNEWKTFPLSSLEILQYLFSWTGSSSLIFWLQCLHL